jgi:hypothetical protein
MDQYHQVQHVQYHLPIMRLFFQVGSANISLAIRLGASMLEFDRGIVGNTLNTVIQSLHFKVTNMHFVRFNITVHISSLNSGATPLLV